MAAGATVCVLTLAGLVTWHETPQVAGAARPAVLTSSDAPAAAAQAQAFLHAPVTSGNVRTAEDAFRSGAPAPEELPPTF
jgi:hypothetical protein